MTVTTAMAATSGSDKRLTCRTTVGGAEHDFVHPATERSFLVLQEALSHLTCKYDSEPDEHDRDE